MHVVMIMFEPNDDMVRVIGYTYGNKGHIIVDVLFLLNIRDRYELARFANKELLGLSLVESFASPS